MMAQATKAGTVTCTHEDGTVETMQIGENGSVTMSSTGKTTWAITAEEGATVTYARRAADGTPAPAPLTLIEAPDKYAARDIDGFIHSFVWRAPDGTDTPLTFVGENPQAGEWTYTQSETGINTYVIPSLGPGAAYAVYNPRPQSDS